MTMERQEYPAMLPQLQPPQAVDILNDRVQQVGKVNLAIAEWLQERRRLEVQYSSGLRKLAQRQLEGVDLGVFSVPWTTLTGSADTLADSHTAFATKIEVDVERPLRDFATSNREMTQMSTIQGNLAAMAKDVERAQQKTDKLRGKGDKAEAGKVASANSDLDTAQTQWESQAPYVFENLQALDETRLNHLRDVLTQFQTHEVDQVERDRITAEQCLNVLLNVETADEIKTFALRAVHTKPTIRPQRNSIATPSRSFQGASSATPTALTPSISQPDDELSTQASNTLSDDKQKGRMKGGLRRLGTVMGRRRESKQNVGTLPPTAESPERKQRPSPFSSLSGRLGRSSNNAPTLGSLEETSPRRRPSSPLRLGSEIFQSTGSRPEAITPTPGARNLEAPPQINGMSTAATAVPAALAILNGSHQGDLADLEPPKPAESQREIQPAITETQKDNEGFSVPPQDLDAISQAQQEAAALGDGGAPQFNVNIRDAPIQEGGSSEAALAEVATKLQAPPAASHRAGTVRGRRDNRNSTVNNPYVPPEQAIAESAPEPSPTATNDVPAQEPTSSGAMDIPALEPSTATARELPTPAPIETTAPAVQPPPSVTGPTLTQSPSSGFTPGQVTSQAESQSPSALRPDSRAATGLDHTRTDSQSIRSSTTAGSQGGIKHPELNETGLTSSIVETVTARFENGKLTSSSMIGEIALAYNPANFSSPFGTENIRLENFGGLEKVAPNPAFITQPTNTEGEYSVNLSSLSKTQVAFKYQVRLEETGSQAPLVVAAAFKAESTQFSVIVSYSPNPHFAFNGRESLTLSNVMLALTVEGAKATSCLSKPVGTFLRDKNLIYWQLNDIVLTPKMAPVKLLARFATDSQATTGSVEARWEITSEHAQGLGSGLSVSMPGQSAASGTDPFADEGGQSTSWKTVPGSKKLMSGSYSAK